MERGARSWFRATADCDPNRKVRNSDPIRTSQPEDDPEGPKIKVASLLTGSAGFSIFLCIGAFSEFRKIIFSKETHHQTHLRGCAGFSRGFPRSVRPGFFRRERRGNPAALLTAGRNAMKRQPLTLTLPLCSICRYKHHDTLNYRKGFPTCDAFPNGIPEVVRKNRIDLRRVISGDNGIHFELAADTEPLKQLLSSFEDLFRKQGLKTRTAK